MNLTIDASVFVAAARVEEAYNLSSRQFLLRVQAQGVSIFCPALVLPECAAAIARPTGDSALGEELALLHEGMARMHLVSLDAPLAHQAVQVAAHYRLRGADSVCVAVVQAFNTTLITLDAEMLERGADLVRTTTPLQWMEEQEIVR